MTGKTSSGRKGSFHRKHLICGAAFSAMVVIPAVISLATPIMYQITDLGAIPNGDPDAPAIGDAHGLNDNGTVVGDSLNPDTGLYTAFSASATMPPTALAVPADSSSATAIDSDGRATGYATFGGEQHAFITEPGPGAVHDLHTLGGNYSIGYSINSGEVVGSSINGAGHTVAFYYTGTPMTAVPLDGPFASSDTSDAYGVNSSGEIVGDANVSPTVQHAYLYDGSHALGDGSHTLDISNGLDSSSGVAINNSGQVVVNGFDSDGNAVSYLYTGGVSPTFTSLGGLGGSSTVGAAVDSNGDVVGSADTGSETDAFIYTSIDGIQDLNDLVSNPGWTLTNAESINTSGQIVGTEVDASGDQHAYLLTPLVPEPQGAGLMLIGASVALLYRRRRLSN
jgi:probable HAF family extracellular repeat protein